MAMRKPGAYAPLYANYADDERIMEVGEDAELMYVRMLAYAARTPRTEGWISDRVVMSRLGILPRQSGNGAGIDAGTDAGSRAGLLCDVGLIERDGDGYRITSWLKWNRSVEEMDREARRDSTRKKSVTSENDGNGAGSRAGNDAGLPHQIPPAEAVQKTDQKQVGTKPRGTRLPADFKVTPEMAAWARKEAPGLDLNRATAEFADYWRAVAGAKGVKLDWVATWRNDMRRKAERLGTLAPAGRGPQHVDPLNPWRG